MRSREEKTRLTDRLTGCPLCLSLSPALARALASLLTGGRVICGRLGTTCRRASLSRRPRDRPPVVGVGTFKRSLALILLS